MCGDTFSLTISKLELVFLMHYRTLLHDNPIWLSFMRDIFKNIRHTTENYVISFAWHKKALFLDEFEHFNFDHLLTDSTVCRLIC